MNVNLTNTHIFTSDSCLILFILFQQLSSDVDKLLHMNNKIILQMVTVLSHCEPSLYLTCVHVRLTHDHNHTENNGSFELMDMFNVSIHSQWKASTKSPRTEVYNHQNISLNVIPIHE